MADELEGGSKRSTKKEAVGFFIGIVIIVAALGTLAYVELVQLPNVRLAIANNASTTDDLNTKADSLRKDVNRHEASLSRVWTYHPNSAYYALFDHDSTITFEGDKSDSTVKVPGLVTIVGQLQQGRPAAVKTSSGKKTNSAGPADKPKKERVKINWNKG